MPFAELDGVTLYYERAGANEPELLFVPGWCCDHSWFRPQFDHFAQSCAVTAVDARGVGRSDAPEQGYTIRGFADDLAALCNRVGIHKPVVVGHSLGGMVGVELAARYPELPRAVVMVDPGPIDPLPATIEIFRALEEQLLGPGGEEVRRAWVEDMGAFDDDLAHRIADEMCKVPLPIAAAVIRGVNEWNGVGALALCIVPTLLLRSVVGSGDEIGRLRRIKPDLHFGVTVGAGHFHQIEVPEQLNAMIERFLDVIG